MLLPKIPDTSEETSDEEGNSIITTRKDLGKVRIFQFVCILKCRQKKSQMHERYFHETQREKGSNRSKQPKRSKSGKSMKSSMKSPKGREGNGSDSKSPTTYPSLFPTSVSQSPSTSLTPTTYPTLFPSESQSPSTSLNPKAQVPA